LRVLTLSPLKPIAASRRRCMSRPSYLSGRPEVPEPPSIAARRRNSNAATLQLQTTMVDPKHRVHPNATVLTPSPRATASHKSGDYFRTTHGPAPPPSLKRGQSRYEQPPTPGVHQHIPPWNLKDEVQKQASSDNRKDAADPLNILDTLPLQSVLNMPATDSRCGTLKRPPIAPADERRPTWPLNSASLNLNASGVASRRLLQNSMQGIQGIHGHHSGHHSGTGIGAPPADQSRTSHHTQLRSMAPGSQVMRQTELSK